jgi:hypothetical protein
MNEAMNTIKEYVLHPDHLGCHMRQMAEEMVQQMARKHADARGSPGAVQKIRNSCLDQAAETIACFTHLAWFGAGPRDYAPRALEILLRLQHRMRGMDPDSTWAYAIKAFNTDILSRLAQASNLIVEPGPRTAMIHRFFDNISDHDYLHDIARNIMELHWQRRHSPNCPVATSRKTFVPAGPRGGAVLERHLRRSAAEALATHIVQSNIARGNIEHPTDSTIILADRIAIQLAMGQKNDQTWIASGWQLADNIETRLATAAGRKEARHARSLWKAGTPGSPLKNRPFSVPCHATSAAAGNHPETTRRADTCARTTPRPTGKARMTPKNATVHLGPLPISAGFLG